VRGSGAGVFFGLVQMDPIDSHTEGKCYLQTLLDVFCDVDVQVYLP